MAAIFTFPMQAAALATRRLSATRGGLSVRLTQLSNLRLRIHRVVVKPVHSFHPAGLVARVGGQLSQTWRGLLLGLRGDDTCSYVGNPTRGPCFSCSSKACSLIFQFARPIFAVVGIYAHLAAVFGSVC